MTVTTNEHGVQNIFAKEPPIIMKETDKRVNEEAEMLNGRLSMLGVVAALGAYITTGQIIPGIF
ncbi:MAG: hypothetical protein CL779_00670 [Chloroflexi bacterium]|mgnify:CR=1 FL=1|nr:hypothetical protein [Chloroflexota bacterium]